MAENSSVGRLSDFLEESFSAVSSTLDLKLKGGLGKSQFILTPFGTVKPTAFVQQSLAGGNLAEMRDSRLLILGIRGLPQFESREVARILEWIGRRRGTSSLFQIASAKMTLENFPSVLSPISLATLLDDDNRIEIFHRAVTREVEKSRATHVALPPVIGIEKTDHILGRLREATGTNWFETAALPPSLLGLRLQRAIDRFLSKPRGEARRVIEGEAVRSEIRNRKVNRVTIRSEGREEDLSIDRLILATGRYLGGGIVKEKTFCEPVLDLPLFSEAYPVENCFVGRLATEKFLAPHPLYSDGVRTNAQLQPVGDRGQVLYENVWTAGELIGGYNPSTQHCGMGVAVGTGRFAGRLGAIS
jgi:glycerol-3-phosphate dehydrogenase subunit B